MDLSFAIEAEAVNVQWTPKTGGSYADDGKWIPASSNPITIRATVQPTTGKAVRDLPEGIRKEARYLLWTRSAVAEDDLINYSGLYYRVLFVWARPDGGFTRAILGLIK